MFLYMILYSICHCGSLNEKYPIDSCILALGAQLVALFEGNCGLVTGCFQIYFASCVPFAVEVIVSQLPTVTTCPRYGLSLRNRRTKINSFA